MINTNTENKNNNNTQLKKGWEVKKLGELCNFGNGLWTGKKPPFVNVGVIRNTNITKDCKLDDSDIVYLNVEQSQFSKRKLQHGDIILEKSGGGPKQPVGRVIIFDKIEGDFSFSNFTSVIRIANPKTLDFNYLHKYLFYAYISGATETMQSHSTGIRNLKFDEYKSINIPLPPLPEQQQIVSILDSAFASIDKAKAIAEQNLRNAKELFESYLENIFENKGNAWEVKTLGKICYVIAGQSPEGKYYNTVGNGLPFYQGKKEFTEKYIGVPTTWTTKVTKESIANDILMSVRAPVGPINFSTQKICIGRGLAAIRASNLIDIEFLFYYLRKHENEIVGNNGAVFNSINKTQIESIEIPVPSIKEQKSITHKIDEILIETKKINAIYQKKLDDLEFLKKSLLQKAFYGELVTSKLVTT